MRLCSVTCCLGPECDFVQLLVVLGPECDFVQLLVV